MDVSALHLLELQIDALFTHDSARHVVAVNEPGGNPAPRFFLGRTREGNLWRVRYDLPQATMRQLEALAADEPAADDLHAEPKNMAAFLEALEMDRAGAEIWSGPAYRFPDALPEAPGVTRITRAHLTLLRTMSEDIGALAMVFEQREPMMARVEDDAAVSLCFSSRLTPRAAEAGVETLQAYRGRGYAPAVVAAWASAVRATDRIPLYSTSWENHASQAVARKLGLIQYGVDFSMG